MNTLTTEKRAALVNFLDISSKFTDFRYRSYDTVELSRARQKVGGFAQKTAHWIGAVDLIPVRENESGYPILYTTSGWKLEQDTEVSRDVDGASKGKSIPILYRFNHDIMQELLRARTEGNNYFNVFLEEIVHEDGRHSVALLYVENIDRDFRYGIATREPWFTLSVARWANMSHQDLETHISPVKRVTILGRGSYNWLK